MNKVFVVLADKKFLGHFKSLYYSAVTNGKWNDDFVVIIPESDKDEINEDDYKGVKFFYGKTLEGEPRPHYYKYYLFDDYFKQWDWIFYCDMDVLFFNEIDLDLDKKRKDVIYANECNESPLLHQFEHRPNKIKDFNERQNDRFRWMKDNWSNTPSFQSCFMLFHKDMITKDRFNRLLNLHQEWYIDLDLCIHGLTEEQSIINVEFLEDWRLLGDKWRNVYQRPNQLGWESLEATLSFYDDTDYKGEGVIAQHFYQFFQPWSLHNVKFYNVYRENLKGFETLP